MPVFQSRNGAFLKSSVGMFVPQPKAALWLDRLSERGSDWRAPDCPGCSCAHVVCGERTKIPHIQNRPITPLATHGDVLDLPAHASPSIVHELGYNRANHQEDRGDDYIFPVDVGHKLEELIHAATVQRRARSIYPLIRARASTSDDILSADTLGGTMSDTSTDLDLNRPAQPSERKKNPYAVTFVIAAAVLGILGLIMMGVGNAELDSFSLYGDNALNAAPYLAAADWLMNAALLAAALGVLLAGIRWVAENATHS